MNEILNENSKFNWYGTFPLTEDVVKYFFNCAKNDLESWYSNDLWGKPKIKGYSKWLKDGGVLSLKGKSLTYLGEILTNYYFSEPYLVWEIIWLNLFYNSFQIKWYLLNYQWGKSITKEDMFIELKSKTKKEDRTINNAIKDIFGILEKSPFGNRLLLGIITGDVKNRVIRKAGNHTVHPYTILYSLYLFRDDTNLSQFKISDLYRNDVISGPYLIFGISRNKIERNLRWLMENKSNLINVELKAGLENIYLNESITKENVIKLILSNN